MARILPRAVANVRCLLLALMAIGLVLFTGAGCGAMAATPSAPAAHQPHCTDTPARPDKPVQAANADCPLCGALPDVAPVMRAATHFDRMEHVAARPIRLAGLAGGPAPPPPRSA